MTTITAKREIDILALFVHDEHDTGDLDASELADALTAHIQAALTNHLDDCGPAEWERLTALKVLTPDETALDRFVLSTRSARCNSIFSARCGSWESVKTLWRDAALPDIVAGSLERLQRSEATWKLSNRKLRRAR